jgi:TRAP-type uncharacterized transport system substrate-binding protein
MNTIDALYFAYAGTGQQGFPKDTKMDKVNLLGIMYNHLFTYEALKSSPINTLADIGTGKVAVPSPTMAGPTTDLLRASGIENPNVVVVNDYNQMNQGLRDGTFVTIMHGGAAPWHRLLSWRLPPKSSLSRLTPPRLTKRLPKVPTAECAKICCSRRGLCL